MLPTIPANDITHELDRAPVSSPALAFPIPIPAPPRLPSFLRDTVPDVRRLFARVPVARPSEPPPPPPPGSTPIRRAA